MAGRFIDPTHPLREIWDAYKRQDEEWNEAGLRVARRTDHGIFYPSDILKVYMMFRREGLENYRSFADLGMGDGRIVRTAALFTNATGFEADRVLYEQAMRTGDIPSQGRFNLMNIDYMTQDLSGFDFIYWFPDDERRENVEEKLLEEMTGRLVINQGIYTPKNLKLVGKDESGPFYHYTNPLKGNRKDDAQEPEHDIQDWAFPDL